MSDQAIEQKIQAKGLTAPRITPADVEANIAEERYINLGTAMDGVVRATGKGIQGTSHLHSDMVTICFMVLKNGHRIVGVNTGPVDANNFDTELGEKLARQNAIDQIWPLMGYELRSKLAERAEQLARRPNPAHGAPKPEGYHPLG